MLTHSNPSHRRHDLNSAGWSRYLHRTNELKKKSKRKINDILRIISILKSCHHIPVNPNQSYFRVSKFLWINERILSYIEHLYNPYLESPIEATTGPRVRTVQLARGSLPHIARKNVRTKKV